MSKANLRRAFIALLQEAADRGGFPPMPGAMPEEDGRVPVHPPERLSVSLVALANLAAQAGEPLEDLLLEVEISQDGGGRIT